MKLGLEDKIKCKIPVTHPVITWLVPHAADLLTKFVVGKDGRTGYERIKGKKYIGELLEFGCCVHCRIPVDAAEGGEYE